MIGYCHKVKQYNYWSQQYNQIIYNEKLEKIIIKETYYFLGFIGLRGPYVSSIANRNIDKVPSDMIQRQVMRDDGIHHITIFSKKEIGNIAKLKNLKTMETVKLLFTDLEVCLLFFYFN